MVPNGVPGLPGIEALRRREREFRTGGVPGPLQGSGWPHGTSPGSSRRHFGGVSGVLGVLWEHFLEVTKFQNINICDDEKLIGPAIKNLYLSKTKLNKKLIDKQREQVVFFGNSSYNLRLLNTVKKILS